MLEFFDQNPQSRVFHVDRECYVVYLGSHWEDYKPFLRLGTSTHLPPELPPIVSTIVVPDVLTGNPLDEPACLTGDATPETRYVGDVNTVEHMKHFVHQETIPVEAIEAIDHEEDDGKHVLVYYYKDGNLKIKFRKVEIFDLRRREKLDGHFVARAQEAKNEYGRGPFKLRADTYQNPGFVIADGAPYLVARGELAALRLNPDYFFELCAAGVDADRVATVQAEDADAALIRYFKRSRTRNRTVRVSTPRSDRAHDAAQLFPANSLPALKAKVTDGHGGAFDFHGFAVTQAPGRFEAALKSLDGPIVFGSAAKKRSDVPLTVDPAAGTLVCNGTRDVYPLLEGTLYQIVTDKLSRTDIEERFLVEKNYPYRDVLGQAENTLLSQLQYFFAELYAGRDTGKVLRTIKGLGPIKGIGKSGAGPHPLVQIMLHNYKQYIGFIRAHEPKMARGAEGLAGVLERHQVTRADVPEMLPLVGEIFPGDEGTYVLYRLGARITSDRIAHGERVVENINAVPVIDFEAERRRLSDLIAGLATPEQMDEARMRRIAEAKKKKKTSKPEPEHDGSEGGESAQVAAGGDGSGGGAGERARGVADRGAKAGAAARGRGGRGGAHGGRRRRGRWILPTAAALLLIAALLALLFTGTIPNPWFGGDALVAEADDEPTDEDGRDGAQATDDTQETATETGDGVQTGDGAATQEGGDTEEADGAGDADEVQLPEGWPPDSLPAIRALEDTPGVTITPTRVIGPGGIEITLQDIIDLVNQVATDNGYATMDEVDPEKPDPDWIYPGNVFVLPNETRYTVEEGDTLWEITVRYMVARLRQDYERYTRLVAEYEEAGTGDARKDELVETLKAIGEASHTENFSRLVEERLDRWGELTEGGG